MPWMTPPWNPGWQPEPTYPWQQHPAWKPPVVRRRRITIIEEWVEESAPSVTWTSTDIHSCPLTRMKPGESMMYYCPTCSGHTTC